MTPSISDVPFLVVDVCTHSSHTFPRSDGKMAPPKGFNLLEATADPYRTGPTGMLHGLTSLLDHGVASGIPDGSPGLFGQGLVVRSILLEHELQKVRLLQQLTLSASSRALESLDLLQNQAGTRQYHRPHAVDRMGFIEGKSAMAGFLVPNFGAASPRGGSVKPVPPRNVPTTARTRHVAALDGHPVAVSTAEPAVAPHFSTSPNTAPAAKRVGRTSIFPAMLQKILADLERQGRADVASFLPHGRAFAIHKPVEFAKTVLPHYFRMGHFSSFQRQLNLYDFQRVPCGIDKGAYIHPLFIKGHVSLCQKMKRVKIKGTGVGTSGGSRAISTNGEDDPLDGIPPRDEATDPHSE